MSVQKKHHYVPITYLNNFLDGDNLWTLNLELVKKYPNVNPVSKSPSQICREDNFYLIDSAFKSSNPQYENLDNLFVENDVFRRIENNYPRIFNRLINYDQLDWNQVDFISDLVIQLKTRNPFYRNEINDKREEIIKSIEDNLKNDQYYINRFGHIPNVLKDYIFSKYVSQTQNIGAFGKNLQLFSLISRELTDRSDIVKAALKQANWVLLDGYYSKIPFITSDNPGISVAIPFNGLIYNTRFEGSYKFYLPLSSRFCLMIIGGKVDMYYFNNSKKQLNKFFCDPFLVVAINDQIMQSYNKFIISSDKNYLARVAKANRHKY